MSGHKARKRFGQNFLHDKQIISRIIDAANPQLTDHFIEIGPGQGAITRPLAEYCRQLDVIEIDRDLAMSLQSQDWADKFTLHNADALQFRFEKLTTEKQSLRLLGNLPYNISTPLLFL